MGRLLAFIGKLSAWQQGALALVLLGALGGVTYGALASGDSSESTLIGEDNELLPVQRGDLVTRVSTSGTLVFPTRSSMTFGVQGSVEELMVAEGDAVTAGSPLARLDAATVASLAKSVAQAKVGVKTAEDALASAESPYSRLALRQAEASVANAEVALKKAQDTLDTARNTPSAADLAKARASVDAAATAFANAERDLKLTKNQQADKVKTARDALSAASTAYSGTFEGWLGITLSGDDLEKSPETLFLALSVDLTQLYGNAQRFGDFNSGLASVGPGADDPTTPWNETTVYTWINFYPGTILATCVNGVVPPQSVCVQKEFDTSWTAQLAALEAFSAAEAQQANTVLAAETKVTTTQDSLAKAQESLDALLAGPDRLDITAKEKQLAVAEETLAKANDDLATILKGSDPLTVALKVAELESARRTLETAQTRLDDSTLKAPFDGVISQANVAVGDSVNPNTLIVEVVDPRTAELSGVVDEIDVLLISQGMQAVVTLDALRGAQLPGTVASISASAQNQQGVVTYPIQVRVQAPPQVTLREGLSATANIVIRESSDVLLVPSQAVFGPVDAPVVKVVVNNKVEERPVVLGDNDGFWYAITEGLNEGEKIVVDRSAVNQRLPQQVNPLRDLQRQIRGSQGGGAGRDRGFRDGGQGQRGGAGGGGRGS